MVSLVRESKGWSQSELAREVDATQGWISKIEAGLVPLVEPRLSAVAEALDCPVSLLADDTPIQGLEVTCLHHRRRHSKIGVTGKRRIEALTHLTRLSVEGLLQGVELVPEAELQRLDLDEFGGIRPRRREPSGRRGGCRRVPSAT